MIIDNASIQLESERSFVRQHQRSESLQIQIGGRGPQQIPVDGLNVDRLGADSDILEISDSLMSSARQIARAKQKADPDDEDLAADSELRLFKMLMEKLLKKKVDVKEFEPGEAGGRGTPDRGTGGAAMPGGNVGLAYDYHEYYHEAEQTSFSARGVVQTKDGRQIDFNLDLEMSREFTSEESISLRMGTLTDPLVLNFDGDTADLTDGKFSFDLDADGDEEEISFLSSNSAFLAFDRNGDGTINDGSELFGPQSGDGFADLAAYDEDGNRFIDEADSIYNKLSLYNKDANGDDVVVSLKERNVGAIYLGNVNTQFNINDAANQTKGVVRSSGVFLEETGGVGTIQHLDLSA